MIDVSPVHRREFFKKQKSTKMWGLLYTEKISHDRNRKRTKQDWKSVFVILYVIVYSKIWWHIVSEQFNLVFMINSHYFGQFNLKWYSILMDSTNFELNGFSLPKCWMNYFSLLKSWNYLSWIKYFSLLKLSSLKLKKKNASDTDKKVLHTASQ